jgi:EpsI family protein
MRIAPPLVAAAVLAVSACLLHSTEPQAAPSLAPTPPIPQALAGVWIGRPMAAEPRALELLETTDVTLMEYRLGQELPVWFGRVGGFGTRAAYHPPELCLVGSDFEVLERGPITVLVNGQERRLMRLVIGQKGRRYEAWYWLTANGRMTPSYYQQQIWLVLSALRGRPASGTLVRISTPMDHPDTARRRLLAFLTATDLDSSTPGQSLGR